MRNDTGQAIGIGRGGLPQRGSALLEFAAVLPLFLALFLATVDFSQFYLERMAAYSAAYNGAKVLACGGNADAAVRETFGPFLHEKEEDDDEAEDPLQVEAGQIPGSSNPERYSVTVTYNRAYRNDWSFLTNHIDFLGTITATGVAAKGSACN